MQANAAKSGSTVALTEAEREAAESLARSPDLIDQIVTDFDRCGLVGERTNKLLCYLAITSRKLADPLSVLILASSGAGKSALQEAAVAFCPPEDLIKLTSLSGKALYYGERTGMKHKVLAVEEGDGLGSGSYALRSLMSAGELVAATTVRNPADGRLFRVSTRVEGPTAVFLTTTNPKLDPETKSRFMVTSVDESREQTQAVLAWQRRLHGPEGLIHAAERAAILRRHWSLQRLLEPVAVVNPFAERLSFVDDGLASRRDQPKYFRLIAAVAFLRQRQKPVKYVDSPTPCAYVEVEEEDIRIASEIAAGLFGRVLGELSRPGFELLQLLEQMRQAQGVSVAAFRFGRREVREFGRWSHVRVHRYMHELVELEYVARESHEGCHRYRLRWDGQGQHGEGFALGLPTLTQAPTETVSPVSGAFQSANVA